jgi:prepilin-type N-terminal cleavage/methylation domain-containing protein
MTTARPTLPVRFAAGPRRRVGPAFTLIELLLAVVIFGIVLAAINTVFYGALRLRARLTDALDRSDSFNQALGFLRRDLLNVTPPGGVLSVAFKIGPVGSGPGMPQSPGLEFYSSTGVLRDETPWGDIQKVTYQLRNPLNVSQALGQDLVRRVIRNLLPTGTEEADERLLMANVQRLEFAGFTGTDWRDSWDTTLSDTNLPTAVRVRIQLATGPTDDSRNRQPVEMLVPLVVQARSNQTDQASGGGQ